MHGLERSKEQLKALSALIDKAKSHNAAEYDFVIPAKLYAVFYSEPMPPNTAYQAQIFVYSGSAVVGSFTVTQSFPDLGEVENSSPAPEPCTLIVGLKPRGDNGDDYTWASTVNVTPAGNGVIVSIPTGETDNGVAVAFSVYMEIKTHP